MSNKVIAIDGPAASGKSTLAKLLAHSLDYKHINSGDFYRAISYFGLKKLGSNFPNQLEIISRYLTDNPQSFQLNWFKEAYEIIVEGEPSNAKIKDENLAGVMPIVASYAPFRKFVTHQLHRISSRLPIVVDGRDIGTVVFPEASKKIFLTASLDARTKRRAAEMKIDSTSAEYAELKRKIAERDSQDESREIAPLVAAADAIKIDSTDLTTEQVLEQVKKNLNG